MVECDALTQISSSYGISHPILLMTCSSCDGAPELAFVHLLAEQLGEVVPAFVI